MHTVCHVFKKEKALQKCLLHKVKLREITRLESARGECTPKMLNEEDLTNQVTKLLRHLDIYYKFLSCNIYWAFTNAPVTPITKVSKVCVDVRPSCVHSAKKTWAGICSFHNLFEIRCSSGSGSKLRIIMNWTRSSIFEAIEIKIGSRWRAKKASSKIQHWRRARSM